MGPKASIDHGFTAKSRENTIIFHRHSLQSSTNSVQTLAFTNKCYVSQSDLLQLCPSRETSPGAGHGKKDKRLWPPEEK
jgi:hypothetical protein